MVFFFLRFCRGKSRAIWCVQSALSGGFVYSAVPGIFWLQLKLYIVYSSRVAQLFRSFVKYLLNEAPYIIKASSSILSRIRPHTHTHTRARAHTHTPHTHTTHTHTLDKKGVKKVAQSKLPSLRGLLSRPALVFITYTPLYTTRSRAGMKRAPVCQVSGGGGVATLNNLMRFSEGWLGRGGGEAWSEGSLDTSACELNALVRDMGFHGWLRRRGRGSLFVGGVFCVGGRPICV